MHQIVGDRIGQNPTGMALAQLQDSRSVVHIFSHARYDRLRFRVRGEARCRYHDKPLRFSKCRPRERVVYSLCNIFYKPGILLPQAQAMLNSTSKSGFDLRLTSERGVKHIHRLLDLTSSSP